MRAITGVRAAIGVARSRMAGIDTIPPSSGENHEATASVKPRAVPRTRPMAACFTVITRSGRYLVGFLTNSLKTSRGPGMTRRSIPKAETHACQTPTRSRTTQSGPRDRTRNLAVDDRAGAFARGGRPSGRTAVPFDEAALVTPGGPELAIALLCSLVEQGQEPKPEQREDHAGQSRRPQERVDGVLHGRDQDRPQPARGPEPLSEDGAEHSGGDGKLEAVHDERERRGQLQAAEPLPGPSSQHGEQILVDGPGRGEPCRRRYQRREIDRDRGQRHGGDLTREDGDQDRPQRDDRDRRSEE